MNKNYEIDSIILRDRIRERLAPQHIRIDNINLIN